MRSLAFLTLLALAILLGCNNSDSEVQSRTYWVQHASTPSRSLIVFVHGILGDAHATWASVSDPDGWPGIVTRDPLMPPVDAMSVGYRSKPIAESSNIEEVAIRILHEMEDDGVFRDHDQIAFVTHSMGGLVIKRALKLIRDTHPDQFHKVKAVVFLATPTHGSDAAALASWISSNPQFGNMRPSDFNAFLQLIDNDWRELLRQRTANKPFPKVYCAYETLSTSNLKVVPRSRAEIHCDEAPHSFDDRDHVSIAKPVSREDALNKYLRARIALAFDPRAVAQSVEVRLVRSNGATLRAEEHLKSGEQYFLDISAARDAWFYVFGRDSTDAVVRYFPAPASGAQTQATRHLRVPDDPTRYITLDNKVGMERLYIFALDSADPDLAQQFTSVADKTMSDKGIVLDSLIRTRGGIIEPIVLLPNHSTPIPNTLKGATAVVAFEHR